MTINLPKDVETSILAAVQGGAFASADDAVAAAWRVFLQQRKHPRTVAGKPAPSDEELQRRLFEAGLLSEIKPSPWAATETEEFTPIPIRGEPLSETVIRERR